MFILITGGSGSGKSEYAEQLIHSLEKKEKYYVATMYPVNRESQEKVDRHRRMRRGKEFQTVEHYTDLKGLDVQDNSVVLLECISNLLANEMFEAEGAKEQAVEAVMAGVKQLKSKTKHLVVVTNEVFSDGKTYDEGTEKYIKNLGYINYDLAEMADSVIEVVYSIPVFYKGEKQLADIS